MADALNRNHLLDKLRFIAATLVVLFHFSKTNYDVQNIYRSFVEFGYLGVPIFFAISGYCIALSTKNDQSPFTFLIRRLFRIFPPYWFSLIIVLAIVLIQKLLTGNNSIVVLPKTPSDILQTLILYTAPLSEVPAINLVYWSLSCEVGFYIIVFFGLFFLRKKLIYYFIFFTIATAAVEIPSSGILYIFKQWPTFMLGSSIYYITENWKSKESIGGFVLLLTSIILILYRFNSKAEIPYVVIALLSALIIYISVYWKSKPNLFSRLGDYSYSIYLIHVPIGWYVFGHIKNKDIHTNMAYHIMFDVVAYTLIILLAKYMYVIVEKPSIKLGKEIVKKFDLEYSKL